MGEPTRVFVLDDHELVRQGLRDAFEKEDDLELVGEAATVAETAAAIQASRPDLALLDVRLPDGDGIEVCREIRSRHPEIRCLMLTSFGGEEAVRAAIVAGAHGFLLKGIKISELLRGIRIVASGGSLLDPAVTAGVFEQLRAPVPQASPLSEQEERVLAGIADGLTNKEIAARLHLADQTVKNYVSTLLGKLGLASRTQAAVYATRERSLGAH